MIASFHRPHRFFRGHAIGGRQPAACWGRWLRWQIGSRLLPYPVEVPWIENSRLVMERGMTGAIGNFYCRLSRFFTACGVPF